MNPEAQRIAIAEASGWRRKPMAENGPLVWHDGEKFRSDYEMPDYLNDLNAMHEAEKVFADLTDEHWGTYAAWLHKIVPLSTLPSEVLVNATAVQRSEAFLRTLGLWKE